MFKEKDVSWSILEIFGIDELEFRFLDEDIVIYLVSSYGYLKENVDVFRKEVFKFLNYFSVI